MGTLFKTRCTGKHYRLEMPIGKLWIILANNLHGEASK